jgi:hypothetical protein
LGVTVLATAPPGPTCPDGRTFAMRNAPGRHRRPGEQPPRLLLASFLLPASVEPSAGLVRAARRGSCMPAC